MDNNWKTMNIKREIFDLYENARNLFNDFYNGHENNYTKEEIELMSNLLDNIFHKSGLLEDYIEELRVNN